MFVCGYGNMWTCLEKQRSLFHRGLLLPFRHLVGGFVSEHGDNLGKIGLDRKLFKNQLGGELDSHSYKINM
jgi:hypothetical protein